MNSGAFSFERDAKCALSRVVSWLALFVVGSCAAVCGAGPTTNDAADRMAEFPRFVFAKPTTLAAGAHARLVRTTHAHATLHIIAEMEESRTRSACVPRDPALAGLSPSNALAGSLCLADDGEHILVFGDESQVAALATLIRLLEIN